MAKILYAASTISHINNFHLPYIEALRSEGNEVLVMAAGEGADFNVAFEKKMFSLKNLKCQKEIKRILKKEKFDSVILNTSLAAFNIRMAMPERNRPNVVNLVHGYLFPEEPRSLKEHLLLIAERLLKKKTDSLIVMNSEDLRAAYRYRFTKGEIRMIKGMGANVPEQLITREAIREELSAKDKYVILFVGELSGRKNQQLLINAMPEIAENIKNAELWLIGSGENEEALKALAEKNGVADKVKFIGYVPCPADHIRAADIYVAPSKSEGLPFNIIEALGTSTPIVASDIKGHSDLIEDGVTGCLFEKGSCEDMIKKILSVYSGDMAINKEKQKNTYFTYSLKEVFPETLGTLKELIFADKKELQQK